MTDAAIRAVHGRRVWDSRGWPTVEVTVELHSGARARAIAPAGASRGRCEAVELRDGGRLLGGRDVRKAIRNVNERIAPALAGLEGTDQEAVDAALIALDGTPLKSNLGGNAIVATSLAVLHAAAAHLGLPLWQHIAQRYQHPATIPLPEIQIFGGGAHADHRIDVQDFMIMVPGAASFEEALEVTAEVYAAAG